MRNMEDVYKRQDTIYCIINTRRLCGRMGMAGSHQSEPVSYTHLDVYKRQISAHLQKRWCRDRDSSRKEDYWYP